MTWHLIRHQYRLKRGVIGTIRRHLPSFLGGIKNHEYKLARDIFELANQHIPGAFNDDGLFKFLEAISSSSNMSFAERDRKFIAKLVCSFYGGDFIEHLDKVFSLLPLFEALKIKTEITNKITSTLYHNKLQTSLNNYQPNMKFTENQESFFNLLISQFNEHVIANMKKKFHSFLSAKSQIPQAKATANGSDIPPSSRELNTLKASPEAKLQSLTLEGFLLRAKKDPSLLSAQLSTQSQHTNEQLLYRLLISANTSHELSSVIDAIKTHTLPLPHDNSSLLQLLVKQLAQSCEKRKSQHADGPWQKLMSSLISENIIEGHIAKVLLNFAKIKADRVSLLKTERTKVYLGVDIGSIDDWTRCFENLNQLLSTLTSVPGLVVFKMDFQCYLKSQLKALLTPLLKPMIEFTRELNSYKSSINDLFTGRYKRFNRTNDVEQIDFICKKELPKKYQEKYKLQLQQIKKLMIAFQPICTYYQNDKSIREYLADKEKIYQEESRRQAQQEARRLRRVDLFQAAKSGEIGMISRDQIADVCKNSDGNLDEELYSQQLKLFKTLNVVI